MRISGRHIEGAAPQYRHAARLELEKPDGFYQPGEWIRGRVLVQAGTNDYVSLSVGLHAYTHGRIKTVAFIADAPLYAGPWQGGSSVAYPFQLQAPRRLPRYQGRLFHLQSRLAVVLRQGSVAVPRLGSESFAELMAAAHPIAEQEIAVAPDQRPIVLGLDPNSVAHSAHARRSGLMMGGFLLLLVPLLLVAAAVFYFVFPSPQLGGVFGFAVGALAVGALALLQLVRHLPPTLAERRLGAPHVDLRQVDGPQGPVVHAMVAVSPSAKVNSISAAIRVIERIEDTADSDQQEERHVLGEVPLQLARDAQPGVFRGALPASALHGMPAGIAVPAVQIAWLLLLYIDIPGYPDWHAEILLNALPGGEPVPIPEQPMFTFW